jgi:hypothetical protein
MQFPDYKNSFGLLAMMRSGSVKVLWHGVSLSELFNGFCYLLRKSNQKSRKLIK